MLEKDPRSPAEKVKLFRSRFSGLEHVYGTYDPDSGRAWQVKQPVTDEVVLRHLRGEKPLGLYLLTGTKTRAAVIDYDNDEIDLPIEFLQTADHYRIECYIEISKAKGYHVWTLFEVGGVPAAKARAVAKHILDEVEHNAEVFPKQDVINLSRGEYGNFINLPLFGRLATKGRTVFLDPKNGYRPAPNQWAFLEGTKLVRESLLDEIIEVNEIRIDGEENQDSLQAIGPFRPPWTLPPCARRILEEGVTEYQRVACFRLAVLLLRIGMPFGIVVAALLEWRLRNRPGQTKRTITESEVKAQVSSAFEKDYKGYGCDEPVIASFCSPECHLAGTKRAR